MCCYISMASFQFAWIKIEWHERQCTCQCFAAVPGTDLDFVKILVLMHFTNMNHLYHWYSNFFLKIEFWFYYCQSILTQPDEDAKPPCSKRYAYTRKCQILETRMKSKAETLFWKQFHTSKLYRMARTAGNKIVAFH